MFTPSFWSKLMPLTSSKHTTSYWRDEAPLAGAHVDEHPSDGRFAARHEMGVRRHLLEQMRLAGAARPQLDQVVVVLGERNHPQEQQVLGPGAEAIGLEADAAQQECPPLLRVNACRPRATTSRMSRLESWIGRRLAIENGLSAPSGDGRVVLELDLGVEAAGQHPLVVADHLIAMRTSFSCRLGSVAR